MKLAAELQAGPYTVRTIHYEDIEALRVMRNASREAFLTSAEISPAAQEAWFASYLERDDDLMFVAVRDGRIVGAAGLHVGASGVEFGRLVVAESERRKGLGFALTATLTLFAARLGGHVWLRVLKTNAPARRLYESLGFVEVSSDDTSIEMRVSAEAVLATIRAAAPDCTVEHYGYADHHTAYVIRRPRLVHSVVLGSYNRPTYVRQAIRSVMDQTYTRWQLVVTDDGSNEATLAAIRAELGDDVRCKLLVTDRPWRPTGPRPHGNVRAVERINDAIPYVTGDIVHYLPDDDWFAPGRFEAFNAVFADPTVQVACGGMRYVDGAVVSPTEGIFPQADVPDPYCVLDQTQVAHRRACFAGVPRWPTRGIGYAADGVFYRQLCHAGYGPVRVMPAIVSMKRRHALNLIGVRARATHVRE